MSSNPARDGERAAFQDAAVAMARSMNNEAALLELRRQIGATDFFARYGTIRQTAKPSMTFPAQFARHINWQSIAELRESLGCIMTVTPNRDGDVSVDLFWEYDGHE